MLNTSGCAFSISSSSTTRVALAAHGLGQLAALLEADVAWRRADQARLTLWRSMNSLMSILMSASSLPNMNSASALASSRLADAGGAEEDERADRALGILEPGAGAADGLGDRVDRLVLADDPLVQRVLHVQQPLGLLLGDARDRDAGPHRHDLGDVLFGDLGGVSAWRVLPVAAQLVDVGLARRPPRRAALARDS